jgi:hypothetical protein
MAHLTVDRRRVAPIARCKALLSSEFLPLL